MKKFPIKNYEEFKELFVREDGKRKNGILLSTWLDKRFRDYLCGKKLESVIYGCKSLTDLCYICDLVLSQASRGEYSIDIMGRVYRNGAYEEDAKGICLDGDFRSYRYRNMAADGRVYKMRIGKLYKRLIDSTEFGRALPPQLALYMCEEITNRWMAHCAELCPSFELHIDDDFEKIYSNDDCRGDFCSCMQGRDNYHFYEESVQAKAAYITDKDGLVIARCVIYTDVTDSEGKKLRLAERQYSTDGDDLLKRMLVYSLIKGGHIDGYKKIGANCHNTREWLDVNDMPMQNTDFEIKCILTEDDYISYQDSFKWYDPSTKTAYNHPHGCASEVLSTTEEYYRGSNWDSWHEEYTDNDVVEVWRRGELYTCDEDCLDDFREVSGSYYHYEECIICDQCDDYVHEDDAVYSEVTEQYYCCGSCREEAEEEYKRENWNYSEWDDDFYPDELQSINKKVGDGYELVSISEESLNELLRKGDAKERNGEYYEI